MLKDEQLNVMLIITSTAVREYGGQVYLASTSSTKIYINLDVNEVQTFKQKYKLNLEVKDPTGPTIFLAFGETAEQIIEKRVRELIEKSEEMAEENEAHNVPEITENMNRKTYIFQIKITAKNYKMFSIHRIYPVDMDLENQYMLEQITQEKRGEQPNEDNESSIQEEEESNESNVDEEKEIIQKESNRYASVEKENHTSAKAALPQLRTTTRVRKPVIRV